MSISVENIAVPSAPDWDKVPFDVGCARCGQDLRGLSDPVCPRCGLTFDWADAVPIEELTCLRCGYHLYGLQKTRCPECGETFTWEEALAEYHRRRNPLFEYQWRRRPVRSFIRTWVRAVRPGRLWRNIDIHDPPCVGPLLVMPGASIVLFALAVGLMDGMSDWHAAGRWLYRAPGLEELPGFAFRSLVDLGSYIPMVPVVLWCGTSFLALLIFRQSMRLYKVRMVHVVRVWAHAVPLMLPVAFAALAACVTLIEWAGLARLDDELIVLPFPFLVYVVWSLRQGYRHYLRMPHALAVAIASQLIAIMAAVVAMVALLGA